MMLKSIDPDRALALVLEHARELPPASLPLEHATGLVLAERVVADRDYPPFDRAAMDGFAVRLADAGRTVPVVGEVAAGGVRDAPLEDGAAVEIMTGAPCPPGTQAVVARENAVRRDSSVSLPAAIAPESNVARRGCECPAGATVAESGTRLTGLAVAALASVGATSPRVVPRPRLAILVTGDEVVPPGLPVGPARIRDGNGAMLTALARRADAEASAPRFVDDTAAALRDAIASAREADVLVLTGGVSAGKYDLVPTVLAEQGFELVFHKVTQKPGKPLLFGRRDRQLVFGLPGNPLSAHLGFSRYVAAALAVMSRRPLPAPERGTLDRALAVASERTSFVLAEARSDATGLRVTPLAGRGSADVFAVVRASAYLRFPPGSHELAAGSDVEVTLL